MTFSLVHRVRFPAGNNGDEDQRFFVETNSLQPVVVTVEGFGADLFQPGGGLFDIRATAGRATMTDGRVALGFVVYIRNQAKVFPGGQLVFQQMYAMPEAGLRFPVHANWTTFQPVAVL